MALYSGSVSIPENLGERDFFDAATRLLLVFKTSAKDGDDTGHLTRSMDDENARVQLFKRMFMVPTWWKVPLLAC